MRTRRQAVTWARGQIDRPDEDYKRECLKFVRKAFDLPPVEPNAGLAWDHARDKHRTTKAGSIPAGVPVFWEQPGEADHVALSIGGGLCISTDVKRSGRVDIVRIASIAPAWGGELLGWTGDLNGFPVWQPPAKPNNVERAREHMKTARHHLRIAAEQLGETPEWRKVAHAIQLELVGLAGQIDNTLKETPKA